MGFNPVVRVEGVGRGQHPIQGGNGIPVPQVSGVQPDDLAARLQPQPAVRRLQQLTQRGDRFEQQFLDGGEQGRPNGGRHPWGVGQWWEHGRFF